MTAATVTIHDETIGGPSTDALTLDFLTERVTARELIRGRVYQEVRDYNLAASTGTRGLVQPGEVERRLNGAPPRERRQVDWEEHYRRALDAFARNRFFILVDDRQVQDLDEEIDLRAGTHVSFLKLVPLVGG